VADSAIIIVNYNSGEWLTRSLLSALRYSDSSIYVVDNASEDTSIADAKTKLDGQYDERINWILNSQNAGFAAANNQVLNNLDTQFAVLMNPDCELRSGVLTQIKDVFLKDEKIGVMSCLIENSDGSLQRTAKRRFPTPSNAISRVPIIGKLFSDNESYRDFDYGDQVSNQELEFVEAVSGAFMVVRMSVVKQVGTLDESYFMHFEDLDWCKRFAISGWKIGVLNTQRVLHEKGVGSRTRQVRVLMHLHRSMLIFFNRYYRNDYHPVVYLLIQCCVVFSCMARSAWALLRRLIPVKS